VRLCDGLAITLAARGLELDSAYRMLAQITDERPWHPSLNDDTGVATLKAGYLPEVQWHHTRAEPFSHGDGLRTRARHMLREVAEKKRSSAQRHVSQGLAAVALQEGMAEVLSVWAERIGDLTAAGRRRASMRLQVAANDSRQQRRARPSERRQKPSRPPTAAFANWPAFVGPAAPRSPTLVVLADAAAACGPEACGWRTGNFYSSPPWRWSR
jgi:hypothetical protein